MAEVIDLMGEVQQIKHLLGCAECDFVCPDCEETFGGYYNFMRHSCMANKLRLLEETK